ncbi:hypothetical protein NQ176_g9372 [Zarea fungicola]|uniref:Uncharacterized protein n=1 Tax=Zarea fungicola TaxID=93591 RepID=A0ACC1MMX1_9HYPO|nr:hypothetical protein NQ176_g9372 [Lecanicillium fungicola]
MYASGFLSLGALVATAIATTAVSYDTGYDDGSRTLAVTSCSDGDNGLITRYHWQTQNQIPRFPFIGGAQAVAGWNSPSCGTCWSLQYQGRNITVLAVDHSGDGFNIGLHAMNELTGGRGVEVGRVKAEATPVDVKLCGL